MKILVNTRSLIRNKLEGIGWFTFETMRYITRKNPTVKFIFVFDRPFSKDFIFSPNVHPWVIPFSANHPFLYYSWFEVALPLVLKLHRPDLFLSPDGFMSLRSSIPSTLVVHDLAFEHHPEYMKNTELRYLKYFVPRYTNKASRIATVSQFSKEDLIATYQLNPDKIDVIYNGADPIYEPISIAKQAETKKIYSQGKDFFLFVGAIQPRKNLANLLRAFDKFKETDDKGIKLMLVGRKGWSSQEIFETYEGMKFSEDVIFTGRVSNKELKHLYGSALSLTYISYFEGFGIPVLEAQQCGCPVIASNTTSLPEVVSDSALTVNPFSVESIAEGMKALSIDEKLRADLVRKGLNNSERFSWEKTADRLWETMMKSIKD